MHDIFLHLLYTVHVSSLAIGRRTAVFRCREKISAEIYLRVSIKTFSFFFFEITLYKGNICKGEGEAGGGEKGRGSRRGEGGG